EKIVGRVVFPRLCIDTPVLYALVELEASEKDTLASSLAEVGYPIPRPPLVGLLVDKLVPEQDRELLIRCFAGPFSLQGHNQCLAGIGIEKFVKFFEYVF